VKVHANPKRKSKRYLLTVAPSWCKTRLVVAGGWTHSAARRSSLFTGTNRSYPGVPPRALGCPNLTVVRGRSLRCTFTASYVGRLPLPGTVSARG